MDTRDRSVRKDCLHTISQEGKGGGGTRQRGFRALTALLAAGAALTVASCGDPARDLETGAVGYVEGFAGGIAAEEPRTALVGRDILSLGGTAADAASAMALTMAVTLPSGAGLGGGGVCVVHDHASKVTEVLDFLPPASPGPVAVPALPRGLFALQAKYGRLRWEQVVSPAETLARFGERVSRALAEDLKATGPVRFQSDRVAMDFVAPNGRPLTQGQRLLQVDLAATLGSLRERGVGVLYAGTLGARWVQAAQALGSPLTRDDLRGYMPKFVPGTRFDVGYDTLHVPPAGMVGHDLADVWDAGNLSTLPAADAGGDGIGAAGLVALDAAGNGVACALTMNGAFGTGRMLPGLGMFAAAPAPAPGQSAVPLAVALWANHNVNEVRGGATATGGGAVANLTRVLAAVMADDRPVAQAVSAVAGRPAGPAVITAVSCPEGLPPNPQSCSVARDPRGAGYATLVGQE